MAASETRTRAVVALIAVPLAVVAIYLGGWVLAFLVALLGGLGALEFYRMAEQKGARPFREVGVVLACGFVALAARDPARDVGALGFDLWVVTGLLVLTTAAIWARGVEGEPLLSVSTTLVGAIYAGALLSFGLLLRHLPGHEGAWHGTALLFAPVLLTWASDTAAYFTGRAWGTRKLIPRVSPGKTVQGAVGALVGTVLVAMAYAQLLALFPTYRITLVEAALFGLLISVVAQVGDLVESLLKRDAGVKDSGTLFPGHGGVLDRVDSLLFTLPVAYLVFRYLIGPGVAVVG